MKIRVTQQHIDEGQRGSSTRDPVAFAMADSGLKDTNAGVTHLRWYENGRRHSVEVPEKVYEFMWDFDNGKLVEPFEFEVEE